MKRNPDKAVEVLEEALQYAGNKGEKGEVYYFRYSSCPSRGLLFRTFANWWVDNDEAAIHDCKLAIEHRYNTKSSLTHLAEMRRFVNAPNEEIKKYYEESLQPTPRHTELLKYGAYLIKNAEVIRGIELTETAIERNDSSPDGYAQLGLVKNREQNLKQVLQLDRVCQNAFNYNTI